MLPEGIGEKVTQVVKFARVEGNDLPLPGYETPGAAGMDLRAFLPDGPLTMAPGELHLVSTGLRVELPANTEMQIRPRSSLALKKRIIIPNSPGTIDEDYRGVILVGLYLLGGEPVTLSHGDRFAQAIIAPVIKPNVIEVAELSATDRGANGFGSTGSQ
ncbi:dUTP diphosphatase [Paracoccus lutimaris]|uniref:Deoxyuridine 5'-triphosphate nucleotidohydrolase n=1 Tax=Paracoccus lutimaris TaxID=1490030 RepID=A0A368YX80_9RHOB|nr:dUTP diphosphatase [Paracoccus lutimaris]RCW84795.1 dUTP pyrophosphatase [Paracoccus lutimaris]